MDPTTLKVYVDDVFTAVEAVAPAGDAAILKGANSLIDMELPALAAILTSLGITSASSITVFVDGLFQALDTKFAGRPWVLWVVHAANAFVDQWLSSAAPVIAAKGHIK